MTRALLLCCCLGLGLIGACAAIPGPVDSVEPASAEEPLTIEPVEEPGGVYVLLPETYARSQRDKLVFVSHGKPEDIPVYATIDAAVSDLRVFEKAERAQHLWRVYRLDARWATDVLKLEEGYRLKQPAPIVKEHSEAPRS